MGGMLPHMWNWQSDPHSQLHSSKWAAGLVVRMPGPWCAFAIHRQSSSDGFHCRVQTCPLAQTSPRAQVSMIWPRLHRALPTCPHAPYLLVHRNGHHLHRRPWGGQTHPPSRLHLPPTCPHCTRQLRGSHYTLPTCSATHRPIPMPPMRPQQPSPRPIQRPSRRPVHLMTRRQIRHRSHPQLPPRYRPRF